MSRQIHPRYLRLLVLSILILGLTFLAKQFRPQAASLTSVSVTMSNSRLSFRGEVDGAPGSNTTVDIIVDSSLDNYTDGSDTLITDALKVNDTLTFTGATDGDRTISEIVDLNTIIINSAIDTTDEAFYMSESGDLTAVFTPTTAVTGGDDSRFELIIPADPDNDNDDGIPDQGYFDFSTTSPTVTCSGGGTGYTWGTGTANAGKTSDDEGFENLPNGTWHVYRCPYTEAGDPQVITMEITGDSDDAVINPVRINDTATKTGIADTYEVIIRNVNSDHEVIDTTTTKVGVIEAVRVSATVVPSLSFEISAYEATTGNHCGQTIHIDTTAASVPFGEITTGSFKNAAQKLKATTNGLGGVVVTAIANDQLGRNGIACSSGSAGAV